MIVNMTRTIISSLSDYLKFFSFIGLSPNIYNGRKTCGRLQILLFIAFFLTLDVIGVLILISPWNDDKPLEVIVGNMFVLSDVMKMLGIFMQSFLHSETLRSILHGFQHIDTLFVNLQQRNIDYRHFRRPFNIKCIIFMICCVLNVGSFTIHNIPPKSGFWQSVIFKCWHICTIITIIHILFYVDLLRYYLHQLNTSIQNTNIHDHLGTTAKCLHMTKKIMNMKLIHFQLWEISQKINVTFGWTISALLLQQFIDSTYCLYWFIFVIVQRTATTITILRRFLFINNVLEKP